MAPARTVTPPPDLSGKVAIVTGSNSGIGYATASNLASLKCHVVLACRNAEKAQTALEQLRSTHPNASMEVMALDLASLESARRFAEQWRTQQGGRAIDLFIANGGSTFMNPDKTGDGKEITYQTNYLTHFLLVRLLLPYIRKAEQPRIVFVSSKAATWGNVSLDNLNAEKIAPSSWTGLARFKTGMQVYGNSKLMQILSAIQLQRLFLASTNPEDNKIATHSVYPGYVGSEISNKDHYKLPKFVTNFMDKAVKLTATSIDTGAKPTLWAALSEEAGKKENWGAYWDEKTIRQDYPNSQCKDDKLIEDFWKRSCSDAGLSEEL